MLPAFLQLHTRLYTVGKIENISIQKSQKIYCWICRNLDKKNTFKVTNIILLFARTFFEVVSRSLIVGCFIYINNDGNFGPHDAVGIYYVTTAFMCFINIFFNQVCINELSSFHLYPFLETYLPLLNFQFYR